MDSEYLQEAEDPVPQFIADINPQCLLLNYDGLVSVQRTKLRFCHAMVGGVQVFVPEDMEQMPEVIWYLPDDVSVETVKPLIEKNISLLRQFMIGWSVKSSLYRQRLEPRWNIEVSPSAQATYEEVAQLIMSFFEGSEIPSFEGSKILSFKDDDEDSEIPF